jgi:hypothetical protein
MSLTTHHVAVDLGASSGRVVLGVVRDQELHLEELTRFWNGAVTVDGMLHWRSTAPSSTVCEELGGASLGSTRLVSTVGVSTSDSSIATVDFWATRSTTGTDEPMASSTSS